jgi:glycerol-3-phosphate acyltransferase PlsY
MIRIFLALLVSYLLGSLLAGPLLARFSGQDLRNAGSGNPGATNAVRLLGRRAGYAVFLWDAGKGWLAGLYIPLWLAPHAMGWLPPLTVLAALLGHVYPVFSRFRGGKGVATFLGGTLALAPPLALLTLLAWAVIFYATGYVVLASTASAVVFAGLAWAWPGTWPRLLLGGYGILSVLILLWRHRANFGRLIAGKEHRSSRRWKWRKDFRA